MQLFIWIKVFRNWVPLLRRGTTTKSSVNFPYDKCIEDFEVRSHSPHTSLHYNTDLILSR